MIQNLSMARIGLGAFGLLLPRTFLRMFQGRGHASRGNSVLVRAWATRELALGMITMHELEKDAPSPRVIEINAAVDAVDAVSAVIGWPAIPRRSRLVTFLGGLAAAGASVNYLRTARS